MLDALFNTGQAVLMDDAATGCKRPCAMAEARVDKTVYMQMRPLVNESNLAVYYKTMDAVIEEEVLLYDLNSFVAAMGGSMGLFLGFSCYQLALQAWTAGVAPLGRKLANCFFSHNEAQARKCIDN